VRTVKVGRDNESIWSRCVKGLVQVEEVEKGLGTVVDGDRGNDE